MFDYHLHSGVSFDTDAPAEEIVQAAAQAGLREICFTDHYDYHSDPAGPTYLFTPAEYSAAYDTLTVPAGLTVRRGVEFGLTVWNRPELAALLATRPFDFVIGSVHVVDGWDPYDAEYWQGKTVKQAFLRYLEEVLACVKAHEDFDVLGHLTYVCKSAHNPTGEPVRYEDFGEITDEILRLKMLKEGGKLVASHLARTLHLDHEATDEILKELSMLTAYDGLRLVL